MRNAVRLLAVVAAVGVLLVLGHLALTATMHAQNAAGRLAAGTCAACH